MMASPSSFRTSVISVLSITMYALLYRSLLSTSEPLVCFWCSTGKSERWLLHSLELWFFINRKFLLLTHDTCSSRWHQFGQMTPLFGSIIVVLLSRYSSVYFHEKCQNVAELVLEIQNSSICRVLCPMDPYRGCRLSTANAAFWTPIAKFWDFLKDSLLALH